MCLDVREPGGAGSYSCVLEAVMPVEEEAWFWLKSGRTKTLFVFYHLFPVALSLRSWQLGGYSLGLPRFQLAQVLVNADPRLHSC